MVKIEEKSEVFKDIKPNPPHHRRRRDVVSDRKYKRTLLCVAKPSYLLGRGPREGRSEYLNELPKILCELLRYRNWKAASETLGVLMQGTMNDGSPKMNRLKYEAQIQIASHFEPEGTKKAEEIGRIYDTWIGKIGKLHKEERLLVWYEQICHFIEHEMYDDANSAVISMMQNRDLGTLPRTNLFIGITYYKLWCCKFSKELQPEDVDEDCDESVSNTSISGSGNLIEYPVGDETVCSVDSEGSARNESESSVMNYRRASQMSVSDNSETGMDIKVKLESPQHYYNNPPRIYASSEENEGSLQDGVARAFDPSFIRILAEMDTWLLPLKPPGDPDCYIRMVNDSYYKHAVSYMQSTLKDAPPHVSLAALHPLIQLLLIGGNVREAMEVVVDICNKVHDIKPFRIKAVMMDNHSIRGVIADLYKIDPTCETTLTKLITMSKEDVLKIDPTCETTLKKLIAMCKEDDYSRESLIEMIALHVEASFPDPEIWEEFAFCFKHFFENLDEDRMSICLNGSGEEENQHQTYSVRYNPTPRMFTGASWTLRAKWWLNRHFSPRMLEAEEKKEDWKLMTYKAACASHIYGREFGYVTKVYNLLKNDNDNRELFNDLKGHRKNWNMIYNID